MEMTDILKKHFDTIEAQYGKLPEQVREALARLDEVEQKAARKGGGGDEYLPSAGRQFVEGEAFKGLSSETLTAGRRFGMEVKAIISSLTTDADGSAGALVVPYRDAVVGRPRRPLVMRDILQTVPITSGSVQYPKLSGSTNSAATVSETAGTTKPQSELKFSLETTTVTTIAHWVYAMRQIMDDAPQLMALIDNELRYGLAYVEDNQILNGGGTGSDLDGIYTQATAYAAPIVPTEAGNLNKMDIVALAMLQQSLANYTPDAIVLHPSDWTDMMMTKDANGNYILGKPSEIIQPALFGLPVVTTPAMTVDRFMVGSFGTQATLYDRMAARVEISTEDGDNFRQNKITVLAEERVALAVKNTEAFCKGTFTAALAA